MWFATGEGVSIWDGEDFNYIYRDFLQSRGLKSSYTKTLFLDDNENVWIGTLGGGVSVFSQEQEWLFDLDAQSGQMPSNDVYDISGDQDGAVWVATDRGIAKFVSKDPPVGFERVALETGPCQNSKISALNAGLQDAVICSSVDSGVNILQNDGMLDANWSWLDSQQFGNQVTDIFLDSQLNIWISTEDVGAFKIDPRSKEVLHLGNLPDNDIEVIAEDKNGDIWLGTWSKGVTIVNQEGDVVTGFGKTPTNNHSLSSNSVISLAFGSFGRAWIGTYDNGANSVSVDPNAFKAYFGNPEGVYGPVSEIVWALKEDRLRNSLWIGTKNGLSRMNELGEFEAVGLNFESPDIREIEMWNDKILLAVRGEGIVLFDPDAPLPRGISSAPNNELFVENFVRLITKALDGSYWVGTHNGLFHLDANLEMIAHYDQNSEHRLPHNRVRAIYESPEQILWIGTSGGLTRFDPARGTWQNYAGKDYLPDDDVRAIFDDGEQIYVATGGGLSILHHDTQTAEFILRLDGLPNETLYSIIPDELGFLWMGTNNGLARLKLDTKEITNYRLIDGLAGNEFNFNAYEKRDNGEIVMGGIGGVTLFNPNDIGKASQPPKLYLKLNGMPLDNVDQQVVNLPASNGGIVVDAAVRHYDNPKKNMVRWRLDPIQDEWVTSFGVNHKIYQDALSPGAYTLKVQGVSSTEIWTPVYAIDFRVQAPIYQTWYAYLLYASLLVTSTWAIFQVRIWQIRRTNRTLESLVQDKTKSLQESHAILAKTAQEKADFYRRIAHELRTPLNTMKNLLLEIPKNKTLYASEMERIDGAIRSSDRMENLIDEIFSIAQDERGLESGFATINIKAFFESILSSYQRLALDKGIALQINPIPDRVATIDTATVETLTHNLLSNSVKYAPTGSTINFRVELTDDELEVLIQNEGHIPEDIRSSMIAFSVGMQSSAGRGAGIIGECVYMLKGRMSAQNDPVCIQVWIPINNFTNASIETFGDENAPIHLLIVEDDQQTREWLVQLFLEVHQVTSVASIQAARRALKRNRFDLVISDMILPDGNAIDLIKPLKSDSHTSYIPFIFLTAKLTDNLRIDGFDAGAEDVLEKPVDKATLIARVENRLNAQMALTEHIRAQQKRKAVLRKETATQLSPYEQQFVDQLEKFIQNSLSDKSIKAKDAYRYCAMSERAFQRKLQEIYGKTFSNLLTERRMEEAKKLLGTHSIGEVSQRVGYSHLSSFSRKFKEYHGASPKEYRN